MFKKLWMGVVAATFLGAAQADEASVKAGLARLLPDVKLDSVERTAVPGLYEVIIGSRLVYMSEDGRYLIQGQIIDTQERENLTENRQSGIRAKAMSKVNEDSMVIFAPVDYKHTVTVFTDIDCGYCRKLHREMADYNEAGIRIRYLFYPRAGVGSHSYDKAVSVWCADDRNRAMTDAKAGRSIESKVCDNPVQEHMALGQQFGLSGTPTLVLDDGEVVSGYAPAKYLAKSLAARQGE